MGLLVGGPGNNILNGGGGKDHIKSEGKGVNRFYDPDGGDYWEITGNGKNIFHITGKTKKGPTIIDTIKSNDEFWFLNKCEVWLQVIVRDDIESEFDDLAGLWEVSLNGS